MTQAEPIQNPFILGDRVRRVSFKECLIRPEIEEVIGVRSTTSEGVAVCRGQIKTSLDEIWSNSADYILVEEKQKNL
jgi:hypothetical protein